MLLTRCVWRQQKAAHFVVLQLVFTFCTGLHLYFFSVLDETLLQHLSLATQDARAPSSFQYTFFVVEPSSEHPSGEIMPKWNMVSPLTENWRLPIQCSIVCCVSGSVQTRLDICQPKELGECTDRKQPDRFWRPVVGIFQPTFARRPSCVACLDFRRRGRSVGATPSPLHNLLHTP